MQFAEQDSGLPEDLLRLVQPVRKVQTRSQDLGEATGTFVLYCIVYTVPVVYKEKLFYLSMVLVVCQFLFFHIGAVCQFQHAAGTLHNMA